MIKNVLTQSGGMAIYGVVSICLFFTVFVAAIVFTAMRRRQYLNHMSSLPLEDESAAPSNVNPSSHE